MDEDPDDLVAAFFAAQSAKEELKAKLPTEDWVDAITCLKSSTRGTSNDGSAKTNERNNDIVSSVNDWLVTTLPNIPQNKDGGIELNTHDCSCTILQKDNAQSAMKCTQDGEFVAARERLKQALVQKLLEETNEKK